jgi:NADPH-dependent curcumin reductase
LPETLSRVLLARRPQGPPVPDDFRLEEGLPLPEPAGGEALVRTVWLSLDPYMRGRMAEGPSYAPSVGLGEVMVGECVGEVVASRSPALREGEVVRGFGGWASHFALPADGLARVDPADGPISTALGVLGMPGLTAYAALRAIAEPRAGETVVVGAAAGAVGSVAGQLAKAAGCRVVGVAGGRAKCDHAVRELGFDACLDRRAEGDDLEARLRQVCPDGVDVYVELTGGAVSDAVLPLLNTFARVPVVGTIARYNATGQPEGPDRLPWLMRQALTRRLRIQGMIVWDHARLEPDFRREVGALVRDGRLRYREQVAEGLAEAPRALIGLLEGENLGKQLVRVGPDPAGAR